MRVLHNPQEAATWLQGLGVTRMVCDSRDVGAGDAFVAWPGTAHDGRRFVNPALRAGAAACLVEAEGAELWGFADPRVAAVQGLKAMTGPIAHALVGNPSEAVSVVAITGTNGKTSTAWWTAQWLEGVGKPAAVMGTLGIGRPGVALETTGLTTPDPARVAMAMRDLQSEGVQAVVVEASSIGLREMRLVGTHIHTAVFTNFTQDHLDYHGSMAAYWDAKRALFDWPGLQAAVVNVDDAKGAELATELQARADEGTLALWTVSADGRPARLQVGQQRWTREGMAFTVVEGGQQIELALPVVGGYNVANLLCALAVLRVQGWTLAAAAQASANLTPVPGRMQSAWPEGGSDLPLVLVDYAHTPDALEKALRALQPLAHERGGRLWCVVGCGGDRDRSKRPLMAAAAEREAARLVLTSDNPRSEDPLSILLEMQNGLSEPVRAIVEPDRALAIAQAVALCDVRDVVLLAGKGHEDYQDVAGEKRPFSDLIEARRAMRLRLQGRAEGDQ